LWCPLLTHYTPEGGLDADRIKTHLAHLSRWVKGFLIAGSTGDGWELSDDETQQLLCMTIAEANRLGVRVLAGALRADAEGTHGLMRSMAQALPPEAETTVCGYTICGPSGTGRSQKELEAALRALLDLGVPTAVYQLPQVTGNELSPELISALIGQYDNFAYFKDSSGSDRVALSLEETRGVFMLRGAEGDYSRWLRSCSGCYDGFLLSMLNGFAPQLHRLLELLDAGASEEAEALSSLLSSTVRGIFALVADLPHGNAFTNANKAVDHWMAHGPAAASIEPPRLHAGVRLPQEVIDRAGEILRENNLLPSEGYLLFNEFPNLDRVEGNAPSLPTSPPQATSWSTMERTMVLQPPGRRDGASRLKNGK
jgi:dihydrodipicolinate synthase/N-acetylneuraminate lyase